MSKTTVILSALVALLLGALFWTNAEKVSKRKQRSPAQSAEQPAQTVQRRPTVLPVRFKADQVPVGEVAPTASAEPAAEAPAPEPRITDDLTQYRDYLDAMFQEDTRDRSRETAAEARIRSGIEALRAEGSRILSVECRASMCKTVLDSADQAALERLSGSIGRSFFWTGEAMFTRVDPTSDKDFRLVVFFGREGQNLPEG